MNLLFIYLFFIRNTPQHFSFFLSFFLLETETRMWKCCESLLEFKLNLNLSESVIWKADKTQKEKLPHQIDRSQLRSFLSSFVFVNMSWLEYPTLYLRGKHESSSKFTGVWSKFRSTFMPKNRYVVVVFFIIMRCWKAASTKSF